jgi:hypothetical protein
LFSSRLFVGLLIPLIILGLGIWVVVSIEVDRSDVRVAGALIGAPDVELTVTDCYLLENQAPRKLVVVVDARNQGDTDVSLSPFTFQMVLARKSDPTASLQQESIFQPLSYRSRCDAALNNVSSIPPDALRTYTLTFWGETLPRGDDWDDYYINLEGYDTASSMAFSKPLNPEEK